MPSAASPPPIRSAETSATEPASSRIWRTVSSSGIEVELRDEPQPAHEPQRILGEAARRDGAEHAPLEIGAAAERIDEPPVAEVAGHRVDGEVAAREIVLDARLRVDDDLEVVPARPGGLLPPRRRELDPGRRELANLALAREEPQADRPARDDEVLDAPVRLEQRSRRPAMSTPGTRKSASFDSRPSSSSRTAPPTRYASRPSDET